MDIYWQITLAETLLNVAVYATVVIFFGVLSLALERYVPGRKRIASAAYGCLFGSATALVMVMPVHMNGGASTGTQSILVALAGLIAGPIAALAALATSLAGEGVLALQSGELDGVGFSTLLFAAASGTVFRMVVGWRHAEADIAYYHLPILGAVCGCAGLVALWYFQDVAAVKDSAVAAFVTSILVTSTLGTLLLHENHRHRAERKLRESKAALIEQARELAVARDEAERANHAKSAFLANMSHELRTPLNAILGFSEIIAEEGFGPVGVKKYKEYAGDIHSSGKHLLSLINDLLDVAKIEAGKTEIEPTLLDARKTIEASLKLVGEKARERRQTLTIDVDPDAPPLFADKRALQQILINLASNAVKYTPDGGAIVVRGKAGERGGFVIVCEDNGPGIPPSKLDTIFKPFNQIDNRFDRQGGGTGLGLALVKGLAELHGGRAWLESEYGHGCSAFVYLPAAPARHAHAA